MIGIGKAIDALVSLVNPKAAIERRKARQALKRGYTGAETNRLNQGNLPKNQAADGELLGPWGADRMRAWCRQLIRDNPWAFSALESIVSETVGSGIGVQSNLDDNEDLNEQRDKVWNTWSENCDLNGQMSFDEIQTLAFRELVEAGECLIHFVPVERYHNGIYRQVPLALEVVEADRLASEYDAWKYQKGVGNEGNQIIRGVEMDAKGRPVAYWIYPNHPNYPYGYYQTPVRIEARNVIHLFRRDRIGQTRGISWFAPVTQTLRDMGVYFDNELQSSAIASCFSVLIETETPVEGPTPSDGDTTDENGNQLTYVEPGIISRLRPGEKVSQVTPSRPNANAEPWIRLLIQSIAAGTGTSYEAISKDFSNTSYSSARTSKMENRTRYKRWQQTLAFPLCQRVWDRFCDTAALVGRPEFPNMTELLDDRRGSAPIQLMPPVWEWVDIKAEQEATEAAIAANQTTYQTELGKQGKNWRQVFRQRAIEKDLADKLGLVTKADAIAAQAYSQAAANNPMDQPTDANPETPVSVDEQTETEDQELDRMQYEALMRRLDEVSNEVKRSEPIIINNQQPAPAAPIQRQAADINANQLPAINLTVDSMTMQSEAVTMQSEAVNIQAEGNVEATSANMELTGEVLIDKITENAEIRPQVDVTVQPQIDTPNVEVNVTPQFETPDVNVTVEQPAKRTTTTVNRDGNGNITSTETVEESAE